MKFVLIIMKKGELELSSVLLKRWRNPRRGGCLVITTSVIMFEEVEGARAPIAGTLRNGEALEDEVVTVGLSQLYVRSLAQRGRIRPHHDLIACEDLLGRLSLRCDI